MSDAHLTSPADRVTIPQPLSDAQVGNAVANKFLAEVHTSLTDTSRDITSFNALDDAWHDLSNLQGDPQKGAVLSAIATKIENHDPSLGMVQGTVERDKSGQVTGFSFDNPQRQAEYQTSLNQAMAKGMTLKEAIASDGTNFLDAATTRGHLEIPANGGIDSAPTAN